MLPLGKPQLLAFALSLTGLLLAQTPASPPASKSTVTKNATWVANEKTVTKLEQDWFKIQLAHDWGKMHQLLGEDFQLIDSDGSLGDADSMIKGYQDESPRVLTISMTLLVSHAVTDDCVVATGLDDISLKDKDGNLSHRYERFTDVWVHRNKQWVCVAEQLTLAHR
jgi:ketosteroid isomerase-like protein